MGGAHLYPTFIRQRKGQPWEWCSVGSLLRIAVKLVKLMFALLGYWSLLESIRAFKCCCCFSTGLVHYVAEHCQNALFQLSISETQAISSLGLHLMFVLTITSINIFRLMVSQSTLARIFRHRFHLLLPCLPPPRRPELLLSARR